MEMRRLGSELWRWTSPHPDWSPSPAGSPGDWDREVGCVLYEPREAQEPIVLIDPLAPQGETPEAGGFWQSLDARLESSSRPVAVVVANSFHHRSAAAVYERYRRGPGASVWAHEAAGDYHRGVGCPVTRTFRDREVLPGGLRAYEIQGLWPGEVALHLPSHEALIVADSLLGAGGGRLRLPPPSWSPDRDRYVKALRPSLRRLLELPLEMVLVSHGEPVLSGGRHALAEALEAPPEP